MPTYILVHGAWSGGWGWTPMAKLLRAKGHDVFVPTLTGLGERRHLLHPNINLSLHIKDVVNLIICERLGDIILVGHSYGGMVITGVAGECGARVRSLVYVDAFLPEDGQSLWDIADEQSRNMYMQGQRETPGLIAFTMPPDPLLPSGEPWFSPHPLLTLIEPVKLSGEEKKVKHHTYALATKPPMFQRFHDKASQAGWKTVTFDTGHGVHTEDPQGVLALLLAEAGR